MPKRSDRWSRPRRQSIISMAQQARPKVTGQIDPGPAPVDQFVERPQDGVGAGDVTHPPPPAGPWTVRLFLPLQDSLFPGVDVADQQQRDEQQHLHQGEQTEPVVAHGCQDTVMASTSKITNRMAIR